MRIEREIKTLYHFLNIIYVKISNTWVYFDSWFESYIPRKLQTSKNYLVIFFFEVKDNLINSLIIGTSLLLS